MEKESKESIGMANTKVCQRLQKFLELANYYHQFIEGFVSIAKPLHDLIKKDQEWNYTEKQEEAFRELKEQFTKEPVLVAPDINKKNENES